MGPTTTRVSTIGLQRNERARQQDHVATAILPIIIVCPLREILKIIVARCTEGARCCRSDGTPYI